MNRETRSNCHKASHGKRPDYLLWGSLFSVITLYALWLLAGATADLGWFSVPAQSVYSLINTMWWGILIGILMVAILTKIPRSFVMAVLGQDSGLRGILRATLGGILLDLCNHGILMVGAKLYERGASAGQVMAFLVASPWNSFSFTLILIALVGFPWTLLFIVLSVIIAVFTGLIFERLVARNVLPANRHRADLPKNFSFWSDARSGLKATKYTPAFFLDMALAGIKESRMVIRWILFGVLLASLVRALVDTALFETYFGPSVLGLLLTMLVATILEVCSEGTTPIAADLLTRAKAPGNSFAFLMTGVSTDYTEILVIKDSTRSWKIALFLPLVTVPQILILGYFINLSSGF